MLGSNPPPAVKDLCPNFFALSVEQQRTFWAYLFQAIAVPESSMNPYTRFREVGIPGIDSVTKQPVWSEGLLQLSYGDTYGHKQCEFDWKRDQHLEDTDRSKTIFDPRINLQCGVYIMARQLTRIKTIVTGEGTLYTKAYYWSVLNNKAGSGGHASFKKQMGNLPGFCTK